MQKHFGSRARAGPLTVHTHSMAEEAIRIVLLGKTGLGKSSLANTLLGEEGIFEISNAANSETKLCKSETRTIKGRRIQLIDTPGLFDTDPNSSELSPELLRCIVECAPGPHTFLLVMRVARFTPEEQAVVRLTLENFSEAVLNYTTVVFTHGDQLNEGQRINEWVKGNKALSDLVQRCGGRCHVFDNKYWTNNLHEYRNNQRQIEELLQTIDRTVRENGGGYYTNDMLQKVHEEILDATTTIQESNPNIPLEQAKQDAKKKVFKEELQNLGTIPIGCMIGVIVGTAVGPALAGAAVGAVVGTAVAILLQVVVGAEGPADVVRRAAAVAQRWLLSEFL